jgi:hypothetical protein
VSSVPRVRQGNLEKSVAYSRRVTPRAEADGRVYAFWYSNDRGDLAHVRNLNLGGIFLETPLQKQPGEPVELYFLVEEGQIRARAVVRHTAPGEGLGLKFTALNPDDRLHFGVLMKRMYAARFTSNS